MALEPIKTDGSETGGSSAHKINVSFAHVDALDLQVPTNTDDITILKSDVIDNTTAIGDNTTAISGNTDDITAQALLIQDNTDDITAIGAPTVLEFIPQAVAPPWARGQVFYDAQSESLSVHSDIDGVTLNLGQEQYIRVVNTSGVPIPNGSVLTQNGVDPATQLPQVVLAIADTFTTATIIGVSTHEIADGAQGFVTTFGTVSELDTGSLTTGQSIYLSSTVAGEWTATAPDIASKVGHVIIKDALNGKIFISIQNNIALPTIYGVLENGTGPTDLTAGVYSTINSYTTTGSLGLTVDGTAGNIGVPIGADGGYRITANLSIGFADTGNQVGGFTMRIRATDGSQNVDIYSTLPKDSESANFYPSIIFNGVGGKNYELQIMSDNTLAALSYPLVTFDITSVHLR